MDEDDDYDEDFEKGNGIDVVVDGSNAEGRRFEHSDAWWFNEQSARDYFLRHAPLDFQVDDLVVAHLVDPDILDDVTSLSEATGVPSKAGPSTDRRTRIVGHGLRDM